MKNIFDLFNAKEKKTLGIIGSILVLVFLFFVVISLPLRRNYYKALNDLESKTEKYEEAKKTSLEKKEEWSRWQEARRDMDELKAKYFYDGQEGIEQLRVDLQQLFNKARGRASRISYDYSKFRTEKVNKINISFNLKGSYSSLKRFIHSVETFPKFLILEKIDFLNTDRSRGVLELRFVLAGYYEIL